MDQQPSPADIETAWGNVVATENMIKEVKKAGFSTRPDPCHLVGYDRCFRHRKDGFV